MGCCGSSSTEAVLAVTSGDTSTLLSLLKTNKQIVHERFDPHQATLLHIAAAANQLGTALILLQRGADITAVDAQNRSVLHYAAKEDAYEALWGLTGVLIEPALYKHLRAMVHSVDAAGNTLSELVLNRASMPLEGNEKEPTPNSTTPMPKPVINIRKPSPKAAEGTAGEHSSVITAPHKPEENEKPGEQSSVITEVHKKVKAGKAAASSKQTKESKKVNREHPLLLDLRSLFALADQSPLHVDYITFTIVSRREPNTETQPIGSVEKLKKKCKKAPEEVADQTEVAAAQNQQTVSSPDAEESIAERYKADARSSDEKKKAHLRTQLFVRMIYRYVESSRSIVKTVRPLPFICGTGRHVEDLLYYALREPTAFTKASLIFESSMSPRDGNISPSSSNLHNNSVGSRSMKRGSRSGLGHCKSPDDEPYYDEHVSSPNLTPLQMAIVRGNKELIHWLLILGGLSQINLRDSENSTILHHLVAAAINRDKNFGLVQIFIDCAYNQMEAQANSTNDQGLRPGQQERVETALTTTEAITSPHAVTDPGDSLVLPSNTSDCSTRSSVVSSYQAVTDTAWLKSFLRHW